MRKKVAIIGGGACALILTCELDPKKYEVAVYEKNAALGRKFLVAGEGGLNLTHSEDLERFVTRYTPPSFLKAAFRNFSNSKFIQWINDLGIETYVGTSGRVFPKKGIKPIEVLNTILNKIKQNKVSVFTRHEWKGFSPDGNLIFKNDDREIGITGDVVIFCLGGASWPVTGSTGEWVEIFKYKGIRVNDFRASNCSYLINWGEALIPKLEGKILKNISTQCGHKTHLGEIVITKQGIEGSGIYPLSPQIREQLDAKGMAEITIDLKPNLSMENIANKLREKPVKINLTAYLKTQLNFGESQLTLLKHFLTKDEFLNIDRLSHHIKNFKLTISGTGALEDAISTVGGIHLEELNEKFELKRMQACYAIGEMLDYDAPTGGYLLQSCFSMGKFVADILNAEAV